MSPIRQVLTISQGRKDRLDFKNVIKIHNEGKDTAFLNTFEIDKREIMNDIVKGYPKMISY